MRLEGSGYSVTQCGETVDVDLLYPNYETEPNPVGKARYIQIGMTHVRATDGFRTYYHFERDGWVIEQAQVFQWDIDDINHDPQWKEVAFVESWAIESTERGAIG